MSGHHMNCEKLTIMESGASFVEAREEYHLMSAPLC